MFGGTAKPPRTSCHDRPNFCLLRDREFQQTRFGLHRFRFVAVPPPHAGAITTAIETATQKGRCLGVDRHCSTRARTPPSGHPPTPGRLLAPVETLRLLPSFGRLVVLSSWR